MKPSLAVTLFALTASLLPAQTIGQQPDGSTLLSTGWRIRPAGAQIPVGSLPMSAVLTPDRKFLVVLSGGAAPSISVVDVALGKELSRTPMPDVWLGLAISKAGDKVFVGGGSRAAVFEFSLAEGVLRPGRMFPLAAEKDRRPTDFAGDVQLSPDGRLLYVADLFRDSVVVINPQSGFVLSRFRTGRRPYRILFHPSGKSVYVSSWADGSIGQFETTKGERISTVRLGPHPTDMVWRNGEIEDHPEIKARLFVSASNTNNVFVLGASESGELSRLETINLGLSAQQPLGTTPSGLSLSSDATRLFVACSDINAAAVVNIAGPRGVLEGLIPTGWYPTTVAGLPEGRLAILNGKSDSVQILPAPDEASLEAWSKDALSLSPYSDAKAESRNRIAPQVRHVVYIVKERSSAGPNQARLGNEFARLDNFHIASAGSGDGHNWATAAIAPDFTQRLWPNTASGRRKTYDFEGQEPTNAPPAGYLWTAAGQAGLTLRNYGYFVDNRPKADTDGTQIAAVRDPILAPNTDPNFRGPDPAYPDVERAKEFLDELKDFERENAMPQLLILRLGSDDTDGALGMIAEGLSKSKFWNETAVFVVDAAPPSGPALVLSPWVKRGFSAKTFYNHASILRTIESILGLRPLTVFDAAATPISEVFGDTPSTGAFEAVR